MSTWPDDTGAPSMLHEVREGVGILTLNRPQKLNAWTPSMARSYFSLLEEMAKDREVRAILLCGAGRAFCAGADMSGLGNIAEGADAQAERTNRPYWFALSIGKPIVAAVQGACMGLGLQLALCCDVRFVADDAKLAAVYAKRGLVGELGLTWLLPRLIGTGAALDLLLSGRSVEAQEALALGLANRIVPAAGLFEQAFDYCKTLASTCAPWSMRALKQQIYADLMDRLDGAYERSEELLGRALSGADFAEGVRAFVDKRVPQFPPLAPELWSIDIFGGKPS